MAMVAGKAVINVFPSMKGFKSQVNSELKGIGDMGVSTGSKIGSALKGAFQAATAAAVALSAATVKIGKDAFQAFGRFQQLEGGVNKLFGESSATVLKNAQEAFKTAGMSANDYLDNTMKFSASLIQSLGGDTAKAAQIADTAIKDMGDNVNTFGSNIEDVQNAYQGFAKQNYTMLDNLRLGYGGTKTEMERLLADATKISGIKYDVSNFADVAQAIHVIQEEMAITGTTTREAANTVEGSIAQMKASWQNLLTAMGSGKNVEKSTQDFVKSITNTLKNAIPVIKEIGKSIPKALAEGIKSFAPQLDGMFGGLEVDLKNIGVLAGAAFLPLLQHIPLLGGAFSSLSAPVAALVAGIALLFANSEKLRESFGNVFEKIKEPLARAGESFKNLLPKIIDLAAVIGDSLAPIVEKIGGILGHIVDALAVAFDVVSDLLDTLPIEGVLQFLSDAADGLLTIVDTIASWLSPAIETLGVALDKIIDAVKSVFTFVDDTIKKISNGFDVAISGIEELFGIAKKESSSASSLIQNDYLQMNGAVKNSVEQANNAMKSASNNAVQSINSNNQLLSASFRKTTNEMAATSSSQGTRIGGALTQGINNSVRADWISSKFSNLKSMILTSIGSTNSIGLSITQGLAAGIDSGRAQVMRSMNSVASGVLTAAKSILRINSPSKVMRDVIGYGIMEGISVGIDAGRGMVSSTFESALNDSLSSVPSIGFAADLDRVNGTVQNGVKVVNQTVNLYETDPAAVAAVLENRQNAALGV